MTVPAEMILLGLGAGASTLIGGVLALRLERQRRLVLGFSSGAVVAVALLELLPEALRATPPDMSLGWTMTTAGLAFAAYMIVDHGLAFWLQRRGGYRGHINAGILTLHSTFDGVAIGVAFQASHAAGLLVAAAVIAHDFSDGLNTVNLSLTGGASARAARLWLAADALAPLAGLGLAYRLGSAGGGGAPLLAALAGALLYIGIGPHAAEPQEHAFSWRQLGPWIVGFGFIAGVVRL